MSRSLRALVCVTVLLLLGGAEAGSVARAQEAPEKFDAAVRPALREQVTLASKDGVLEVRLTARQGEARLDTVAAPVKNALVFSYELVRGTASNGQTSGVNLYPAPTLQVFPGETLIIHLDNALTNSRSGTSSILDTQRRVRRCRSIPCNCTPRRSIFTHTDCTLAPRAIPTM